MTYASKIQTESTMEPFSKYVLDSRFLLVLHYCEHIVEA